MEFEPAPPPSPPAPPYAPAPEPSPSGGGNGMKKAVGPLAAIGSLLVKFKFVIFGLLKFLPTFGTMLLSVGVYALSLGWWFALGLVLLIFVHECGHLIAAKRLGLKVGAPVFIPFMGAFIALKEAPRNAWVEAQVGIGGPILGTIGAAVCYGIYSLTGEPIFRALAYFGFWVNLFNLAPFGFLDGGRIVTALSPWLWLVGVVVIGGLMLVHFSLLLLFIVIASLPRLFTLFRKRTFEEERYYEVTTDQRWIIGGMYFGLIAFLMLGMMMTGMRLQ